MKELLKHNWIILLILLSINRCVLNYILSALDYIFNWNIYCVVDWNYLIPIIIAIALGYLNNNYCKLLIFYISLILIPNFANTSLWHYWGLSVTIPLEIIYIKGLIKHIKENDRP